MQSLTAERHPSSTMPRAKSTTTGGEPKKRSRTGCHGCKNRKVKCDEAKPTCSNCVKVGEACDYSLKLQWGGRSKKEQDAFSAMANATSGFSTVSFAPPSIHPASNAASPGPTLPVLGKQDPTKEGANKGHSDRIGPQLAPINRLPEYGHPSDSTPGRFLGTFESTNSYSSLPRFALPDPYQSASSPSGQHYRSPSMMHSPSPYEFSWSNEDRSKRTRLASVEGPSRNLPPPFARPEIPEPRNASIPQYDQPSPGAVTYMSQTSVLSPLTPWSSVAASPGLRRLSVNYLLSGPSEGHDSPRPSQIRPGGYRTTDSEGYTIYGYDYGMPDMDIPRNDDLSAINPQTPASAMHSPSSLSDIVWSPSQLKDPALEKPAFERGGYYARPVPIRIPKELEPLPAQLSDSPMNLIYFHHFLNHTARILVPHDCPDNPLKTTLPRST